MELDQIIPDPKKMFSIRARHQRRTLAERIKDESSTEPFAKTKKEWIERPNLLDWKCVDIKPDMNGINLGINFSGSNFHLSFDAEPDEQAVDELEELKKELTEYDFEMWKETDARFIGDDQDLLAQSEGGEIAYAKGDIFSYIKEKDTAYLQAIWTHPTWRGQCYGEHLLRELTKWADKNCITLRLDAQPFDLDPSTRESIEHVDNPDDHKEMLKQLVGFYSEFGFGPTGKIVDDDTISASQFMVRPARCVTDKEKPLSKDLRKLL